MSFLSPSENIQALNDKNWCKTAKIKRREQTYVLKSSNKIQDKIYRKEGSTEMSRAMVRHRYIRSMHIRGKMTASKKYGRKGREEGRRPNCFLLKLSLSTLHLVLWLSRKKLGLTPYKWWESLWAVRRERGGKRRSLKALMTQLFASLWI